MCTSLCRTLSGRRRANGPIELRGPIDGAIDDAIGMDLGIRLDATILQVAVRTDAHAIAELDVADQHRVHVDENIAPDGYFAANIDAGRVCKRDTVDHQLARAFGTQRTFELCELHFVVDAEHFRLRRRNHRIHLETCAHGHDDDVGKVILALRVVVLQVGQPFAQRRRRHRHESGIDLANGAFFSVRILLLDDAHDIAGVVANDAAVPGRIGEHDA